MCDVCVVPRVAQPGVSLSAKEELATSTTAPIPIPVPQAVVPTVFQHGVFSTSEPLKRISGQGSSSSGSSSTLRSIRSGLASEPWASQQNRLAHRFLPPGITVEELAAQDPKRARRYVASMQSAQRSKARKLRQILHLEEEVHSLQAASLRQLKAINSLRSEIHVLSTENSRLALDLKMQLGTQQGAHELAGNGHPLLSIKSCMSAGAQDEREDTLLPIAEYPGHCAALRHMNSAPAQDASQLGAGTTAVGFWPFWAEALSSGGSAQHLIAQAFADLSVQGSQEPLSPGQLVDDILEHAAFYKKHASLGAKTTGHASADVIPAGGESAPEAAEQICGGNAGFEKAADLRKPSQREQGRNETISEGWELADVAQADPGPDTLASATTPSSAA